MSKDFYDLFLQMVLYMLEYNRKIDQAFQDLMDSDLWIPPEVECEGNYSWNLQTNG